MSEVAKAAGSYLSSLQQLGAEATWAPWEVGDRNEIGSTGGPLPGCGVVGPDYGLSPRDARFIATARNCWEALVNVAAAADEWVGVKGALTHSGKIESALAALRAAVEGET